MAGPLSPSSPPANRVEEILCANPRADFDEELVRWLTMQSD